MKHLLLLRLWLYWLFCKTKYKVEVGSSSLPAQSQCNSLPSAEAFLFLEKSVPRQPHAHRCAQLDEEVTRQTTGTAHALHGVPRQQSSSSSKSSLAPFCCTVTWVTVNLNGPPAQGAGVRGPWPSPGLPQRSPRHPHRPAVSGCLPQAPNSLVVSW